MKRIWPFIVIPILIALPFVWYFEDRILYPDAQFHKREMVRVYVSKSYRIGIIQSVNRVGEDGEHIYFVRLLDNAGDLEVDGWWFYDAHLMAFDDVEDELSAPIVVPAPENRATSRPGQDRSGE